MLSELQLNITLEAQIHKSNHYFYLSLLYLSWIFGCIRLKAKKIKKENYKLNCFYVITFPSILAFVILSLIFSCACNFVFCLSVVLSCLLFTQQVIFLYFRTKWLSHSVILVISILQLWYERLYSLVFDSIGILHKLLANSLNFKLQLPNTYFGNHWHCFPDQWLLHSKGQT